MSSWNRQSLKKYSASSPSLPSRSRANDACRPAARPSRSAVAVGRRQPPAMVCATRPESNSASSPARRGAGRGASGSAAVPRCRCGLRLNHHSWNHPTCPSSHSGGFSWGEYGTMKSFERQRLFIGIEGVSVHGARRTTPPTTPPRRRSARTWRRTTRSTWFGYNARVRQRLFRGHRHAGQQGVEQRQLANRVAMVASAERTLQDDIARPVAWRGVRRIGGASCAPLGGLDRRLASGSTRSAGRGDDRHRFVPGHRPRRIGTNLTDPARTI